MLMNLFSVFDPVSYFYFSLNWIILVYVVGFCGIFFKFYKFFGTGHCIWFLKIKLNAVFKEISSGGHVGLVFMSFCIFNFWAFINVIGLFPFVFSGSAHLVVTLSVGVVMWLSFFIMGWVNSFMESSAHLVPYGSPLVLAPFMVVIESISQFIRPFTLSVRLAANMMAGHLIIGLLSSICLGGFNGVVISLVLQSIVLVLEIAVCVIQSFVFSVLLLLYVVEYY